MTLTKYRLIDENGSFTESLNLQDAENHGNYIVITEEIADLNKPQVPETNTPAEFLYGLERQDSTEEEVLDFIENHIEDLDTKLKARILFKKAIEFERYEQTLNLLIGAFNQFRGFVGKQPIDLDLLFITGKKLKN